MDQEVGVCSAAVVNRSASLDCAFVTGFRGDGWVRACTVPHVVSAVLQVSPQTALAKACMVPITQSFFAEWGDLARGARADSDPLVDRLPGTSRQGWQEKASDAVENEFLVANVRPIVGPTEQALFRSQQGPMAALPFTCIPITTESRFQPQELQVLFLRRLWQPLPLSSLTCRCGRPLDPRGHHRAACPLAWVLGRRGFSLENADLLGSAGRQGVG